MELLNDRLAASIPTTILSSTGTIQIANNRRAVFTGTATETHPLQIK